MAQIILENAEIRFKNFSGAPTEFSPAGNRTFAVMLEPEVAQELFDAGWNVKGIGHEDPNYRPFLSVKVSYPEEYPSLHARCMKVDEGKDVGMTLFENTVGLLDTADILHADLRINGKNIRNNPRFTAYLAEGVFVCRENRILNKYEGIKFV